ncbi:hypothetical protein [Bradyrhizobium sp. TM233]|uniref:hypothetical protein n=1 Tax=Bradyrhizobium sp. TM233 TaxID=2599801 RepID=UPI0030C68A0C|nr:hypothetical protein TM233_11310 [Bradyrhizobium sp. TM233]
MLRMPELEMALLPSSHLRLGACVTGKSKDLPAVMLERFGDVAGFVGRPRVAAAE